MPSNLLMADTMFPHFTEEQSSSEKIKVLTNYIYLLLEQLRYTLANLGQENFNAAELDGIADLIAGRVTANTVISNTVITNELYAGYGSIADLTVDKLRTDYKRARLYLAGDTSPLDYIRIHDEMIEFVTASTDGSKAEQMHEDGRYYYWTDETFTQMTGTERTKWPVYVYVYTELIKGSIRFEEAGDGTKIPVIRLGAGTDSSGVNGVAVMKKLTTGLSIRYTTEAGKDLGVEMLDSGVVQVSGPLVLGPESYGAAEPTGTPKDGQMYCQIVE